MRLGRSALEGRGPNDRGSASVEFALVIPILVLILFMVVVAGSVYVDQLHLQTAARNAARAGSVSSTTACSTASSELANENVGTLQCTVLQTCTAGGFKVQLVANRTVVMPIIGNRSVTLRATSTYTCST